METIKILTMIFISLSMGMFFGALITFWRMHDTQKALEEELDAKNHLIKTMTTLERIYTENKIEELKSKK